MQYLKRLNDYVKWFERKINFSPFAERDFVKRQRALEKALVAAKLKTKTSAEEDREKFDNVLDTKAFEVRQQLKPTVLFVTQNAYRCLDVEQAFRLNSQMFCFFTKHYPVAAVVEMINEGVYERCRFAAITTSRLLKLFQIGALDTGSLKHVVLDVGYLDDNDQTPFEYDMARTDLRVFMESAPADVKIWLL